ncbi:hypothetical protein H4V97_001090 [Flavobacterium sp. CG_23.5]|uniref:RNA ligase family protein n=1 Tax=Flavobacterium sp. CG_23.5 TaxID=2760708 RepID=UPI001AE5056E|nr:RNA ligase family protein [Flavobacterium sp. CG_23.5]MBP2282772.1 hypothetical protein [Flavobacterium sp. CG_23.5]
MKKYPSIEQFRNVIRTVKTNHDYQGKDEKGESVYSHNSNYPTLKFKGTVKLHGTNAGIVKYPDGKIEFQSRERVLELESDNAGFMNKMHLLDFDKFFNKLSFNEFGAIYGEWCGGNVQKGVAINGLEKMFVIFGVKVDDEWVEIPEAFKDEENKIFNINQFKTSEVEIDFNSPELIQNRLIELTIDVENECPVGKHFGNIGIGEGIVFTSVDFPDLKFKSKGEKHSASKVKVLNEIDVVAMESINEFVELSVTENRLKQGLEVLKENGISIETKSIGEFLRWIVTDILKEEKDTLETSGLDEKKVKGAIVNKARFWFLNNF